MADPSDARHRPPPAAGMTVVGTDPRGTMVVISQATSDFKANKHDELRRSPEHTVAAIEQPRLIAAHPEHQDRLIYVGQDREPEDIALAPKRRIVVAATSSPSTAKFITGFDERSSRLRTEIGRLLWELPEDGGRDESSE